MKQTSEVRCPHCKIVQEDDIYDLTNDTGELEGTFPHVCDNCRGNFKIEYEYKPFINTLREN